MSETAPPSTAAIAHDSRSPAAARRTDLNRRETALVVLLFILAGHAWSIDTGLFLDDHAHYTHLREASWTVQGLVEASRLGIVGDVMDLWGRHEAGLRFFRPVAFAIMKLEYTLVRWEPMPMHVLSLAWHFVCAMLVGELAYRCFGRRSWATVAAALLAIHPGHVATVYWIACQTELMTTAFLLCGTLAYAHYARWPERAFLLCSTGSPEFAPLQAPHPLGIMTSPPPLPMLAPKLATRAACALLVILCYGLALGCRENAVLFPLICLAGDRLLVPRERRRFRIIPLLLLGVLAAYLVLRWHYLGGFPTPARPYLYRPSDPGFALYVVEKIVYYTIGLFGFVPVIPMGGQAYFASHATTFYGGFAGTVAVLLIIWAAYRFRPALVWPVAWIACTIAPVVPVFASSHHLYLPSVGTVLLLTAGLAALGGLRIPPLTRGGQGGSENDRPANRSVPKPQLILCAIVLLLHAVGLSLFTWGQGFAYRAGTLTEDILLDELLHRSSPIRDGDHFFFINMPVLAYYAMPALESELGWNLPDTPAPKSKAKKASGGPNASADTQPISPPYQGGAGGGPKGDAARMIDSPELTTQRTTPKKLHGHVLTFSPWLMRMEKPGTVEILDDRRIRVRAPDEARYFEGVTGKTLLEAMGLPTPLPAGTPIRDDDSGFTVTPTVTDERGVREFLFEFNRPISTPGYHFVFGSPQFLAYPLQRTR